MKKSRAHVTLNYNDFHMVAMTFKIKDSCHHNSTGKSSTSRKSEDI